MESRHASAAVRPRQTLGMAQVLIRRGTVVARRRNPSVARLIATSQVAHERELRPAPVGEKGGESRFEPPTN
jgi:hypothetical protein